MTNQPPNYSLSGFSGLQVFSFSGPNCFSLTPCGVVLIPPKSPFNRHLSASQDVRMKALLNAVMGSSEKLPVSTDHLAVWMLQLLLRLQSRVYYPVNWGSIKHRADGVTELGFELGRNSLLMPLVETMLTLLECMQQNDANMSTDNVLAAAAESMHPRLSQLYVHDRHKTAERLGIFAQSGHILDAGYSLVGQGSQAKVLTGGYSGHTSKLGREIANDKRVASAIMLRNRLPVAHQTLVDNANDAVSAAERIGYPVVLKPLRGHQSKGVSVNLRNAEAVRAAYERSQVYQHRAVIEPYLQGLDYRLLVVGGQFLAAVQRHPSVVLGDGGSSISQLVAYFNQTAIGVDLFFDAIVLDADALRVLGDQGLTPDSIPRSGETVQIRRMVNMESTATDVTDRVHPDNRALAVDAAQACAIDVAGIDFVSPDISQSWRSNGAGIVEINTGPSIDMHLFPQAGQRRDVSWHMIRSCLPAATPGRMPIIMVTGYHNKRAVLPRLASLLALQGYNVGLPCDQEPAGGVHPLGAKGAAAIADMLTAPAFDAGVFAMSLQALLTKGVPVDRVAVSVITDDRHGLMPEDMRSWGDDVAHRVYRLACDVATAAVVIDGTSAALRNAVAHRWAWQVGYIWPVVDDAPLLQHLGAGGWAVTLGEDTGGARWLHYRYGATRVPLLAVESLAGQGQPSHTEVRLAMIACAALIGLGTEPQRVAADFALIAAQPDRTTSLLMQPTQRLTRVSCDQRDAAALQQLASLQKRRGAGLNWLVLADPLDTWAVQNLLQLEGTSTYWCAVGTSANAWFDELSKQGVAATRLLPFDSIAEAAESISMQAQTDDLLGLLSMDAVQRRQWADVRSEPQSKPATGDKSATPGTLWQSTELAMLFDGAWVNGPVRGWGVNRIVHSSEPVIRGDLVVICGKPDDVCSVPQMTQEVLAAFDQGACAVIAPLVVPALERWKPVLVCDDPQIGLLRLADAARQRSTGLRLAVTIDQPGECKGFGVALEAKLSSIGVTSKFDFRTIPGTIPAAIEVALALGGAAQGPAVLISPMALDARSMMLFKPNIWVLVIVSAAQECDVEALLPLLPAACHLFAAVLPTRAMFWRGKMAHFRNVHIDNMDDSSTCTEEFVERVASAIQSFAAT